MTFSNYKISFILFTLLFLNCNTSTDIGAVKAQLEECRERNGLPEFFKKVHNGDSVKVVYIGGSITNAIGWRGQSFEWLKTQNPVAKFKEINACVSGTESYFGACRLSVDVLAFKPDLVFIEFRANGGDARSMEGIVRQIWRDNPKTDICFVYTIANITMLESMRNGLNTPFGLELEKIADHYGIPSIDFAPEVLKMEKEGTLIFQGTVPIAGKLIFTPDWAHPTAEGHVLYTSIFKRVFDRFDKQPTQDATLRLQKQSLNNQVWEKGSLLPVTGAKLSNDWEMVDIQNDTIYTRDKVRSDRMLRGAVKCAKKGETIELNWEGIQIGFNDITSYNNVVIEVSIDGSDPITITRTQNNSKKQYARYYFTPILPNGKHTIKITIKEITNGEYYYVGQFMQVGTIDDSVNVLNSTKENKLNFYPNPTRDKITVLSTDIAKIIIFDMFGRICTEIRNSQSISIAALRDRQYLIQALTAEGALFNEKVLKL